MIGDRITLRLEYIVEKRDFEPYEQVKEFSIAKYIVGSEIRGKPILGLQIKENDETGRRLYRLYRIPEVIPIEQVDSNSDVPPREILFKIRWHNFFSRDEGVSAAYVIAGRENLIDEIEAERDDIHWKYLLTEEDGRYYLTHLVPEGPNAVDPCQRLKDKKIICSNPRDHWECAQCMNNDCITRCPRRSPRGRWRPW